METLEVVKSKPVSPEKEKWYGFQLKEEQETPKRLEDAAKFLASMISISLTIFFSVSGHKGGSKIGNFFWEYVALTLWIISLITSFFVLFPFRYRFSPQSIKTFIESHKKTIQVKRAFLIISLIFFSLALIILGFVALV